MLLSLHLELRNQKLVRENKNPLSSTFYHVQKQKSLEYSSLETGDGREVDFIEPPPGLGRGDLLVGAIARDVALLLTLVASAVVGASAVSTPTTAARRRVPALASQMPGFSAIEAATTASATASESTASTAPSVSAAAAISSAAAAALSIRAIRGPVTLTSAIVANHRAARTSESSATSATSATRAISGNVSGFTAPVARSIAHLRFAAFLLFLYF